MKELVPLFFELASSLLSIAFSVLPIVGIWLVFEKAGESGWKSIIPVYNIYTLLKITNKQKSFKIYIIGLVVYLIAAVLIIAYMVWVFIACLAVFTGVDVEGAAIISLLPAIIIIGFVALIGYILMLIPTIQAYCGVCDKMHINKGYVFGLLFLPAVFWMLIGVSKKYQWEKIETPAEYIAQ